MKAKAGLNALSRLFFFSLYNHHPIALCPNLYVSSFTSKTQSLIATSLFSSSTLEEEEEQPPPPPPPPQDSTQLFRSCGCTDAQISKLFLRQPSLRNADITKLESKLTLLFDLGFTTSDLVDIINRRPRFLYSRIGHPTCINERIQFLQSLFGSKQMLLKGILRNPSLLNYSLDSHIKPCISLYQQMGIYTQDLIPLLISHPTLIPRSSLNDEKLDYIRRIGVSTESKMYKYVVSIIAISRLQTIREKVANFEKFGFSNEEVFALVGRSPFLLTLSIDKVQRNMTYIIGTIKLPANVVLTHPFLLYSNLESTLKARFLLAEKIHAMDLVPQVKGPLLLTAFRKTEKRFLDTFVHCHSADVANQLIDFYTKAKGSTRLAETSKRAIRPTFPF